MLDVNRRQLALGLLLPSFSGPAWPSPGGTATLYNGIRLPSPWPPRRDGVPYEPMPVPYLAAPPEVIPIDLGRQLLVDDFLIAETNLARIHHEARYYAGNPVLKPDRPWETNPAGPAAMTFSDGVWFDPKDRLFKIWYMAGYWGGMAYAFSEDGLRWTKPKLDVKPGTNIVFDQPRGSTTVWLDLEDPEPARRFKLFRQMPTNPPQFDIHFSADGIHWTRQEPVSAPGKDRSTLFRNPFRKVWVFSLKDDNRHGRFRRYWESEDILEGNRWRKQESIQWVGADYLDRQRDDLRRGAQLYNLDAVAYESLMLGFFSIWRGQPADRPKPNEVLVGYSRDGFHWHRPNRRALMPVSEHKGDWNWGNVQSTGGYVLMVGDQLYCYVSGRAGGNEGKNSGTCTVGLARLRRDGFVSLHAGELTGTLTTRPVQFSGTHLFVNANASNGSLEAELLELDGQVIQPFSRRNAVPMTGDSTRAHLAWTGAADLAGLAGRPVRIRFYLREGDLYSFWVSKNRKGSSGGYLAAGGPGYSGPVDAA